MPAGKSPNNAFILHKAKMEGVLRDIDDVIPRVELSRLDKVLYGKLSKPFFYWIRTRYGDSILHSKGWVCRTPDRRLGRGEAWMWRKHNNRHDGPDVYLVTLVRKYYTDGVRAIGAME